MSCFSCSRDQQNEILVSSSKESALLNEKYQKEQLMKHQNTKFYKKTEIFEWRCISAFSGLHVNPKEKIKTHKNPSKIKSQQALQEAIEAKEDEIKIYNQIIEMNNGQFEFIHTYECGFQNEEIIVLVHGYGGNAMTFVKSLQKMSEKYHVYAIDLLGFGMSSRPNFEKINTPEKVLDFMNEAFDKWRQAILENLTVERNNQIQNDKENELQNEVEKKDYTKQKITLVGHSYGGYLSSMYTISYPDAVKRLILLSPIGTTHYTEEYIKEADENLQKRLKFYQKPLYNMAKNGFKERHGPTNWMNRFYFPSNYIIKRFFVKRLGMNEKDMMVWKDFMVNQFKFKESCEKGFFNLFHFPSLAAKKPLRQELLKLKGKNIPINFMFGDNDWMTSNGAQRLHEKQEVEVTFQLIQNCGHQITFEQPLELAKQISLLVDGKKIKQIEPQHQSKSKDQQQLFTQAQKIAVALMEPKLEDEQDFIDQKQQHKNKQEQNQQNIQHTKSVQIQ